MQINEDICRRALETYGIEKQRLMLFEEMAELQNAICKEQRGRVVSIYDICEEIADVAIMCEQMALYYGKDRVEMFIEEKMERLSRQLGGVVEHPHVDEPQAEDIELCGLLWDEENLVIDGQEHFTFDEAQEVAAKVGKRLPTPEEWEQLCALGSTWDDEHKGRWFGGNHDTDHEGSLFLPAAGGRGYLSNPLYSVSEFGRYWAAVPNSAARRRYLGFSASGVYPLNSIYRAYGFCVRLVRDVSK